VAVSDDETRDLIMRRAEEMAARGQVARAAQLLVDSAPEPSWDELERVEITTELKLKYVAKCLAAAPTLQQRKELLAWRKAILEGK
jgi:hypothetical protein